MSYAKRFVFCVLILSLPVVGWAQRKANPAFAEIKDDPNLPRVLLLGDSISIGYTVPVRKLLEGKANVHRAMENCGPTTRGLERLEQWLGEGEWDVIHFNWGLHDLKFVDEKGKAVSPKEGEYQVPIEQYEKNLTKLVKRLKQTKAKLIWASTTPVPEGTRIRISGDAAKYNEVAAKVMQQEGVETNDLYGFCLKRLEKIQRPKNVHFTPEGSQALGEQVAKAITAALEGKTN